VVEAKHHNMIVMGPYSADAFFARGYQNRFDAVLAMYHDQGLIPLKSLAFGEGINYTAGLPVVRTSPDHGTALDIAGKDKADPSSFTAAIFGALDILKNQNFFDDNRKNPLRKMSSSVVSGGPDE
jgi:4-hydroxythreonine-4-phosphate dehydrogenase